MSAAMAAIRVAKPVTIPVMVVMKAGRARNKPPSRVGRAAGTFPAGAEAEFEPGGRAVLEVEAAWAGCRGASFCDVAFSGGSF
jgi:hypothetical protein